MQTVQVDLPLLKDTLKQPFVTSHVPARSPSTWTAGLPRVVPVWFHGDDRQASDLARAQKAAACHRPAGRHCLVIPPPAPNSRS